MKISSLLTVAAVALALTACSANPAPAVEQPNLAKEIFGFEGPGVEPHPTLAESLASTPATPSSPQKVEELRSYLTATSWESTTTEGTTYNLNDDGTISTVVAGIETHDPVDVWFVEAPTQLTLTFSDGATAWMEVTTELPEPADLSNATELHLEGTGANHGIDTEVTLDLTLAGTSER